MFFLLSFKFFSTLSFQQAHMFEYLECLMEGLKTMGGERIRVPERRRFDPDESCKSRRSSFYFD